MSQAQKTQDHREIRQWLEERGGSPATVTATKEADEAGVLRIDFPDYTGEETLQQIT